MVWFGSVCFPRAPAADLLRSRAVGCSGGGSGGATVSAWEVRAKQKHDTGADLFPRESRGARLRICCAGGDGRSAGRALCQPTAVRGSYFLSAAPEFLAVAAVPSPSRGAAVGPVQRGRRYPQVPLPGRGSGERWRSWTGFGSRPGTGSWTVPRRCFPVCFSRVRYLVQFAPRV